MSNAKTLSAVRGTLPPMATAKDDIVLPIGERDVVVTHASKLLIPDAKVRKLDLVNYYLSMAEGALRGAGGRPCVLVRYPDGIGGRVLLPR
jgi:DNA primase